MNRDRIATKWVKVVEEHLGVDPDRINEESHYVDDLGADSLDLVELTMAAEEEFRIEIPDDEAEQVTTVKDSIDLIEKKLGEL